jgi:predicted secreted protein
MLQNLLLNKKGIKMRQFFIPASLLVLYLAQQHNAQSENQLNYNIVNVQAEATRQVSNDLMNAVLLLNEVTNNLPSSLHKLRS